jgi:hypothetical protein
MMGRKKMSSEEERCGGLGKRKEVDDEQMKK